MALTKNTHAHFRLISAIFSLFLFALTIFCISASSLHASERPTDKEMLLAKSIDAAYAEHFGTVLLQGRGGRIQPVDTVALTLMKKVTGERTIFGLSHSQVFVGLVSYPELWQKIPMVRVKHPKIKALLGISEKDDYFAFNDIYKGSRYVLDAPLRQANARKKSERSAYENELLSIAEALGLLYGAYNGDLLKIFPIKNNPANAWATPSQAMKTFQGREKEVVGGLLQNNFYGVKEGLEQGSWKRANDAVSLIKTYQEKTGAAIIPPETKIETELYYNKYNIFEKLIGIYLVLGMVLFALVFAKLANPAFNILDVQKKPFYLLGLAFVAQTAALGMRWYISDHAPWGNAYETMIYISWTVMLAGLLFAKRSMITAASAAVFAALILYAASLSWLDPQITLLPPILKSLWFTSHVSIITASYGFFGLCAVLGAMTLVFLMILQRVNDEERAGQINLHIKETQRIIEMGLITGLILITVGNFIGAAWANASWGRLWGWDPKETWTLVSILIYTAVIHMRFVPKLHTTYNFTVASIVSFASVLMTYFGVNYYLSGMHSYAAGDPVPVPLWVYYTVVAVAVLVLAAFRSRNAMKRAR